MFLRFECFKTNFPFAIKVFGALDTFYAINSEGVLYRRTGVTSEDPAGTGWEDLGFRGVIDVTRTDGKLVVLLRDGTLRYKNGMYDYRGTLIILK